MTAPIIVVQGSQNENTKLINFTEIILPPGKFETTQQNHYTLTFVRMENIQQIGNMISFCPRKEYGSRSESPTGSCLTIDDNLCFNYNFKKSDSDEDSDFEGGKVEKTQSVPKIFYKGHYNIRQKTKRQFFIRTKHEGDVPISIVRKWARKKTNA